MITMNYKLNYRGADSHVSLPGVSATLSKRECLH